MKIHYPKGIIMAGIKVNDEITVSPQIFADDISEIIAAGFKSIICNRPDGEAFDQPDYQDIANAAKENGIDIIFQPIIAGTLNINDAQNFSSHLTSLPKPVFTYCRTGTRCITLWAIAEREQGTNIDEIINHCAKLGYDVAGAVHNIK